MEYNEGSSVVRATVNVDKLTFKPESRCKPTFVITPRGTDEISVKKVLPTVDSSGTLTEKVIWKHDVRYERELDLFGEKFVISENDQEVFIFSRVWPISGHGSDLNTAIADLGETIRDLKYHYAHTPIEQLGSRAVLFREAILSLNL
jgi:hypothetical protein